MGHRADGFARRLPRRLPRLQRRRFTAALHRLRCTTPAHRHGALRRLGATSRTAAHRTPYVLTPSHSRHLLKGATMPTYLTTHLSPGLSADEIAGNAPDVAESKYATFRNLYVNMLSGFLVSI